MPSPTSALAITPTLNYRLAYKKQYSHIKNSDGISPSLFFMKTISKMTDYYLLKIDIMS